ncbi:tetratricopeptide repeat protein [Nucisporomicrobium flavum]|uniref:tetratricopeptide repeat protein n=1 Tax=Nucisporomicrobium flavum TaxID=2785915 RepID=UPI0018F3A54B|nr:tetratricopeptide repeat protein [Nucisporomicrobium flavum]
MSPEGRGAGDGAPRRGAAGRDDVRSDVHDIVERMRRTAEARARGLRHTVATRALLLPLTGATDYGSLRRQLDDLSQELEALTSITSAARAELEGVESRRAEEMRFSDVWWDQRQEMIRSAGSPQPQGRIWVRTFVEAMLARQYPICRRLTTPGESAVPADAALVGDAAAAIAGLSRGRLERAVPLLQSLVAGPWAAGVSRPHRLSLVCLLVRSLLSGKTDRVQARRFLDAALATVAGASGTDRDARQATLRALEGELLLAEGDPAAARAAFEAATRLVPDDPLAWVGLGLVAERTADWFRAQECYDTAASCTPPGYRFGRLFEPAPGNLYWRLSRRLVRLGRHEEALEALDEALRRGVSGGDQFRESRALTLRAETLLELGRPVPAAEAFHRAGLRFQSEGDYESARDCLVRACDGDPGKPVYRWSLAEVLRIVALGLPANDRSGLLDRAAERWEEGAGLGEPGPGEAWAYVTLGLIRHARRELEGDERRGSWEAAIATQHALVLDARYGPGWAFLAMIHNWLDNSRTALVACDNALELDPGDEVALQEHVTALLQLGRFRAAGEALDRQHARPGAAARSFQDAYYLLLSGDPDGALRVLAAQSTDEEPAYRMARALCLQRAGRDDEAREEATWYWEQVDRASIATDADAQSMLALAAYLLGHHDEAEEIYEEQLRSDREGSTLAALGLVRLARGDPRRSDAEVGRENVLAGMAGMRDAGDVVIVADILLPELVRRLERDPAADAGPARALLDEVARLADRRRETLADDDREPEQELQEALDDARDDGRDGVRRRACHGALGLLALSRKKEQEALTHFGEVAHADAPEGRAGLLAAVRALQDAADGLVAEGVVAQARDWYDVLMRQADALAEGRRESADAAVAELRAGLRWRAVLAAVELGQTAQATALAASFPRAERDAVDVAGLKRIGQTFVRDVDGYWRQVDGLAEIRAHDTVPRETAEQVDVLRAALRLDGVYQLRRSDADPAATFPLTNPVMVRLGERAAGPGAPDVQPLLHAMRKRVERAMGITVSGIKVVPGPDLAPETYEVCFEGVPVRSGRLAGGDAAGLDGVVADVEAFVVANLARLFGPDDLLNWAAAADGGLGDASRDLLEDREFRLAVHRVLRHLLWEGVPLTARAKVLETVSTAVAETRCKAMPALEAARARLVHFLPDHAAERKGRELPADLAADLAAGLVAGAADTGTGTPQPSAWQRDRPDALAVTERLREWWHGGGDPSEPVVVDQPELRPIVWRLLAACGERPTVLARGELRR